MKKHILFTLLTLSFLACQNTKQKSYSLKVTMTNVNSENYEGYAYLVYDNIKDSTLVVDNAFEFKGTLEKSVQGAIHLKGNSEYAWVYLENSDINGTGQWSYHYQNENEFNIFKFDSIQGSTSQDIIYELGNFKRSIRKEDNQVDKIYKKLKTIATQHPKEPVVGTMFATQSATTFNQLTYDHVADIASIIDSSAMHAGDMEMINYALRTLKISAVGNPFPPFSLSNTEGKEVNAEQFKGKYTLVDFWASWCGPCRQKHPKLIDFYKKNQDKDFTIVSISNDQDKEAWKKAIQQDNLTHWPNAWDKGSQLNMQLGIMAIPYSYLLDKEGKILGKNLTFNQMQNILDN